MNIILFFTLLLISLCYFLYQIYRRISYLRLGRTEDRSDQRGERRKYFWQTILLQKPIAKYPLSGIFHAFIMWGFVILIISSINMAVKGLFFMDIFILQTAWFLFLRDLFILLVVLGVVGFAVRRLYLKRTKQDWMHSSLKSYSILALIFLIVLTELVYLTTQAALTGIVLPGAWLVAVFVGVFSGFSPVVLQLLDDICWWLHYVSVFSFFFVIPNSKHLHLIFAPLNIYRRSLRTKGALVTVSPQVQTLQAQTTQAQTPLEFGSPDSGVQNCGAHTVEDFTSKQLLDTYSCVLCGRCHRHCPAERSKETLKPKRLNGFIRSYLEEEGASLLKRRQGITAAKPPLRVAGELFRYDFIWSCTTCGGCNDACPVSIDHISKIIDMRRSIVSEQKDIPGAMKTVMDHLAQTGNPFGRPRKMAQDYPWAAELGIPTLDQKPDAEFVFFVGCQGSLDESTHQTAAALAKVLQHAGENVAILGEKEWCCGETVRRMGNELLYQRTVRKNIADWAAYGIKKIITLCPHCYNTLKNEYPEFGGDYDVVSHVALLAELITRGKLVITKPLHSHVTYHDPCYLGRYNAQFEEPREILRAIPGVSLTEMTHHHSESFCCGAGGGRFWTRGDKDNPISANRVKNILATEADVAVTACPYCRTIFSERIHQQGEDVVVKDIAEILAQNCL
ncbi:4Fe-4S dicluster domain-containing protein [Dehalobacter sp. DCM]|uniref:heterodisulfide reductase-related iron-sulfur binding cluster n=1 Tax=Dehalobacter sp. DCM TaxID=2907827 RepID=UPI003081BE5E|nr:4Fe-4S dicluster domain-containing protein [Dehalobacter sp. DCM]